MIFFTWLKSLYYKFLAYLGRGGSDNEGQP
jgi:hypothetical protein